MVSLVMLSLALSATVPATRPSTQPSDIEGIKAAWRGYWKAQDAGDAEALKRHVVGSDRRIRGEEANAEFTRAARRFEAALARQFKDYPAPSVDQFVESEWGEVRITITGDKALLRGVDGSKCSLRNVNGAWKVDLDASGTEPNERRFRVWREWTRVLDEMTRETSAGTYGSWIDAKQERSRRVSQALQRIPEDPATPSTRATGVHGR
jgi:hypothetical protein